MSDGIIHISYYPSFRLRLSDGGYVFMLWHKFCGPTFFKDKYENREIESWYENEQICSALDWFINRGEKA